MLTLFGVTVLSLMMLMYALEARGRTFVLTFAVFCVLSSLYGFLAGAWPLASLRRSGQGSPSNASSADHRSCDLVARRVSRAAQASVNAGPAESPLLSGVALVSEATFEEGRDER